MFAVPPLASPCWEEGALSSLSQDVPFESYRDPPRPHWGREGLGLIALCSAPVAMCFQQPSKADGWGAEAGGRVVPSEDLRQLSSPQYGASRYGESDSACFLILP